MVIGINALKTKSKGGATAYLQHNSGGAEEGTTPKLKGISGARFLMCKFDICIRDFTSRFGNEGKHRCLGSYHMLMMIFGCNSPIEN